MQKTHRDCPLHRSHFLRVLALVALAWTACCAGSGSDDKSAPVANDASPADVSKNPVSTKTDSADAAKPDTGSSNKMQRDSGAMDASTPREASAGSDATEKDARALDASSKTADAHAPAADAAKHDAVAADAGTKPTLGRIFATMAGDYQVLVIDEAKRDILERYSVGEGPAIIVCTPDRAKLFTANWMAQSVSAINTAKHEVVDIDLTGRPYVIAMDPQGKRLYTGVYPTGIAVINADTNAIEKTLETADLASSITVSADGKTLYVANTPVGQDGTLRAVSADTGAIIKDPIPVGATPAWITSSPDGRRVYTLNFYSDDVAVVDTEKWQVVARVPTGTESKAIVGSVTPDGSALYVTNFGTGEVMRIDTARNEVTQTIKMKGRPIGIAFSPDGKRLYVTDFGDGTLDQPTTDFLPYLLAGAYEGPEHGRLTIFDLATGKPLDELTVGKGPTSVVVSVP